MSRWRATAFDLALFRIVVALLLAFTSEVPAAVGIAAGSHAAWRVPVGLGWFVHAIPLDGAAASLVRVVHYNAAALAAIGLFTRPALALLGVTSFYVLALSQFSGAVLHDMHLLWFVAILTLASAGDALSVDGWLARTGQPLRARLLGDETPSRHHALALRAAATLLGLVYFFPGAWKLGANGLAWALSDNVVQQMHAKWFEYGVVPAWRVDRVPALVRVGALLALVFELSFVVLVQLGPRVRVALALAGLAFHLSIQRYLMIGFASLWLCYVALVPWHMLLRSSAPAEATASSSPHPVQSALIVAFVTVLGLLLVERGVRGATESWPVACYPRFHLPVGPTLQDLRVVAIGPSERDVPVGRESDGRRKQADWATAWSVAGIYGVPFSEERFIGYLRAQAGRPNVAAALAGATSVRAEVVAYRTAPEAWGEPPVRTRPLTTVAWP